MPVRSLTQFVLRWPEPERVLAAASQWASEQGRIHPSLQRVGVHGSYGRGEAGVGSDLDLLLIDDAAEGPQHCRLLEWPLERLPLSCDALVLTSAEFELLIAETGFATSVSRMATTLRHDLRWLWSRHPATA